MNVCLAFFLHYLLFIIDTHIEQTNRQTSLYYRLYLLFRNRRLNSWIYVLHFFHERQTDFFLLFIIDIYYLESEDWTVECMSCIFPPLSSICYEQTDWQTNFFLLCITDILYIESEDWTVECVSCIFPAWSSICYGQRFCFLSHQNLHEGKL